MVDVEHDTDSVDCLILYQSQKAVFVETWDGRHIWIPLSQIYNYDELDFLEKEDEQVVKVAKWFVLLKGLSYY